MLINKLTILFLFLIFTTEGYAQFDKELCKPNEKVVFAFQLKNLKWISVCKEKNGDYIVYRFGNQNKIELQYPGILDSTSWQQFTFQGYSRGGGKQNAAMRFGFLGFYNNEVHYEVYDSWNAEDDRESCGIWIERDNKTIELKGNLKSRKGSLVELINEDKIKKESEN